MRYSEDPDLRADGDPNSEDPRERCPRVGQAARDFTIDCEDVIDSLFEVCTLFRVPVTNNIPWFEDGDADKPIYEVGEFITIVKDIFLHHGWTPPTSK